MVRVQGCGAVLSDSSVAAGSAAEQHRMPAAATAVDAAAVPSAVGPGVGAGGGNSMTSPLNSFSVWSR